MHPAHLLLILFFGEIVSAISSIECGSAEGRREVRVFVFTGLAPERFNSRYQRVLCPTRKSWQVNKVVLNVAPNKATV